MLESAEIRRLADFYRLGADETHTPEMQAMIRAHVQRINYDFDRLPVRVQFVDHDPYGSYAEMAQQVQTTGVLQIWKGASDVPMWDPLTNWKARAVHDWDHISKSFDFSMQGEYEGFRVSAAKSPQLAPIALSEIALQAALFSAYGSFGDQKIVVPSGSDFTWATNLKGLDDEASAEHTVVPTVAVLVSTTGPESAAAYLGALGFSENDAIVLVEAANVYNAMIQGQAHA